jgi:hypothetical protein
MTDPIFAHRNDRSAPLEPGSQDGEPAVPESVLGTYLGARCELFSIEARELAGQIGSRGAWLVALALLGLFSYGLVLAGLIGWLATLGGPGGLAWYTIALILGAVHLLLALIVGFVVTRPLPPAFPFTRQELHLDSAWLQSLKKRAKKL